LMRCVVAESCVQGVVTLRLVDNWVKNNPHTT